MGEDGVDVDDIGEFLDVELTRISNDVKENCSMVLLLDEDSFESFRISTVVNSSE